MVEEQEQFKNLMNRIKNRTLEFPTAKEKKAPNSVAPCKINYIKTRIKFQSFRALIRYLNDENLTQQFKNLHNRIKNRTVTDACQ